MLAARMPRDGVKPLLAKVIGLMLILVGATAALQRPKVAAEPAPT